MDYIKKFLLSELGAAEAASSAIMIGMASGLSAIWNGGVSGIWDSLISNPLALILVFLGVLFGGWIIFKS